MKPILVAGVDEAGRGPLAGPVVTAAVILRKPIAGVTDSKMLTAQKREALAVQIYEQALCCAYGRADPTEIDTYNIHHATLLAMRRAIEALTLKPCLVLVDGLFVPPMNLPCKPIVRGDFLVNEIAAASILAKVARDKEMQEMDNLYPGYAFSEHKGYSTRKHQDLLKKLGPCPIHRRSFQLVAQVES